MPSLTRRSFVTAAVGLSVFANRLRAADFTFVQYHNQTVESSLHKRLVEMWDGIRNDTNGRVVAQVHPENNKLPGGDPAALKMLVGGEIQFFTLMGGILGTVVPVAEVQQVPFSFSSAARAHAAMDGTLGAYIREEMAAKGIYGFRTGAFDNGMRQIAGKTRPVRTPRDLAGIRMRVPAGQMVADTFRSLGAEPITINSNAIYGALQRGEVDAQENPLALIDLFKLYEVVTYVSMTNHMWSGFNLLAHLPTWNPVPDDLKTIIERHVARSVRLQRQDQAMSNARLRGELTRKGLVFNDVDAVPFRKELGGFYARWKSTLGTRCWSLLEEAVGRLT